MCGIIGYIGKRNALPILIEGLKKLEYRGYDSAGLAIFDERKKINVIKAVGKVKELEKKIGKASITGHLGIAHTRWATHGHPSERNAHPHADCAQKIWLAHNGIIENHTRLSDILKKKGHKFRSETDTEIVAHLIEENYDGNLVEAVSKTVKLIKGTYGLVVIHQDYPEEIVAVKLGSPLVVGLGVDENIVTSDASVALLSKSQKVIYLNDGEMARITAKEVKILNRHNKQIKKEVEELDWEYAETDKGDFPNFMLKEIFEQPATTQATLAGRLKQGQVKLGGLEDANKKIKDVEKIYITACGTARCAGLVGEYLFEEYLGLDVEVDYASEFKYRNLNLNQKNSAVLAISQSGETADTKAAIEKAKERGLLTLGIVNVVGSAISRLTDAGVYTHSGPEIAVASTKAFTSQLTVLALMNLYFGEIKKIKSKELRELAVELSKIPGKIKHALKINEQVKRISKEYHKYDNFAFMGRKYNYPVACEGAIKLKELSYVHAEGFPSGEMKHGPIAMIDKDFPSVFIAPTDSVYEKNLSNMEEIKARNGKVIAITTIGNKKLEKIADDVIYIPKTIEALYPLLTVIPLQLLAYHIAIFRGNDVDKPRNLAKSVTVE
jgi:glutamine---fructose-6-phosphate transaminase (isomerizing)